MVRKNGGVPIVLTSPRSDISVFGGDPFSAFVATFPLKVIPKFILKPEWFSAQNDGDGKARFMPYGLRKVESMLIDEFGEENVVSAHPDNISDFVGPDTKVVGISTMDALGMAYVSVTYNSIIGLRGRSVTAVEFDRLLNDPVLKKYKPKLILGGAGTWQVKEGGKAEEYGIDTLFYGEAEGSVVNLFKKALAGEELPKEVKGTHVSADSTPIIKHPASFGMVEITRGCGRGCKFCSPTNRSKFSVPPEKIMKEVEINVRGGCDSIFTATEDMFLYESKPRFVPNREKVVELYRRIASHPGVKYVHLSHASLAPAAYDPKMVEDLTYILEGKTYYTPELRKTYKRPFITVLFGIETGSIRLMKKYMKGKPLPYDPDNWHEVVLQGVGAFNDNNWRPMGTVITGWPGETEDDTLQTLELLDKLKSYDLFLVPLLFIPLEDAFLRNERTVPLDQLTEGQWDFIAACWKHNIDWWRPDLKPIFGMLSLFLYVSYFRWVHGRKLLGPALRIAGLSKMFPAKPLKACEPIYCSEEKAPELAN